MNYFNNLNINGMNMIRSIKAMNSAILAMALLSACNEDEIQPVSSTLRFHFEHKVNGNLLETDKMIYTNAAENVYEVSEIMYFISDIKLYNRNGHVTESATWSDIHYIDENLPASLDWIVSDKIPPGTYDSLTFTFGISEEKNNSFMFVNPPEVNMAWPEVLGGGYHYMMMNGWWNDSEGQRKPFNFHLGIGQVYENNTGEIDDITGFVHNAFRVNPGGGSFVITEGSTLSGNLVMNIESWFDTPYIYDHNHFGGAIMQNQEAMHIACMNGADVFSLTWE